MAQLIIAAAGAAASSALGGGIIGGIGGAFVSGLLSSVFAPTQKVQGPRLGDLSVGGSSYGAIVPYIEGHPRLAGQIIWASAKREIATTTRQGGKGGGGTRVTTFTYEVDLLILLTDCEIDGVVRIFSGGDLVYTVSTGADNTSIAASQDTPQWQRLTVYTGSASQLPDPDYAAAVGEANAPAYRDRGTVFIKSLQLGQDGQIPNLTFEVVRNGDLQQDDGVMFEEVSSTYNTFPDYLTYKTTFNWSNPDVYKFANGALASGAYVFDDPAGTGTYAAQMLVRMRRQFPGNVDFRLAGWVRLPIYANRSLFGLVNPDFNNGGDYASNLHYGLSVDANGQLYPALFTNAPNFWYKSGAGVQSAFPDIVDPEYPGSSNLSFYGTDTDLGSLRYCTRNPATIALDTWTFVALIRYDGQFYTLCGSTVHKHHFLDAFGASGRHHAGIGMSGPGGGTYYPPSKACNDYAEELFATASAGDPKLALTIGQAAIGSADYPLFDNVYMAVGTASFEADTERHVVDDNTLCQYDFNHTFLLTPVDPPVADVVERLCLRAGLAADQFDVTGIAAIPTLVHAMAISQPSTTRAILEMLMGCYFFDAYLTDKIYFVARAGAAAETIAYDDLGWVVEGQPFADPLPLTLANELELPAQIALTYSSMEGDQQTDTQYSDRLLTSQENTSVVQVPLGLTAEEAKIIADARLTDMYVALLSTTFTVNLARSKRVPTDVVLITDRDGSTYRKRLLKRSDAECILAFDAVLDDATVFTQLGLTVGGTGSQTTVAPIPDTVMELLDIPILSDDHDMPGLYVAVSGPSTWHGCSVFHSLDGVSYTLDETVSTKAVIGAATTALTAWTGGVVFDETSAVTVDVGDGELESSTRAALIADRTVNAAVIGNELVQFHTATLISEGVYRLTGFLRGRRGTDWAMTGHAIGDRFVLLTESGMRFLRLDVGDLARLRFYKAATSGQRLSQVGAESITPVGVGLECFSPYHMAVDREGTTTLSMLRRTRLRTRIVGPYPPSAPLGEGSERYELDIFDDNTYTTVVRTLASTTPEFEYTDEVADFGSVQAVLHYKAYQLSDTVGRGYPLTGAI